jgi:ADP-heptose:LPS heptosyltransferase
MSPEDLADFIQAPDKVKRILVIRLDNIGDMVMLGPALRAIRSTFRLARITLMASPAGSMVAPLLPWVDEVFTWEALWQDLTGRLDAQSERELELIEILRAGQYQAAFIFTSFSQSPHPAAYACYLAGIPLRVGHSKEFAGQVLNVSGPPPEDSGHQVERNLALLEMVGIPVRDRCLKLFVDPHNQEKADQLLEQAGVNPHSAFIAVAPGASCNARRYDPIRFAEAARQLAKRTKLPQVLLGSERERETLAPFFEGPVQNRPWASLIGKTNVAQLAAVIRRSCLVLANNSASLHIADAFQRPMVIVYSGTEFFSQWEPRLSPARLLRRETQCSPCYQFNCPYQKECLDIPSGEVVEAATELLNNTRKTKKLSIFPSHSSFIDHHLFF